MQQWCAKCAGLKKLTLQECIDLAINKNGKCLSTEYKNIKSILLWECEKGHTWYANFNNVKDKQQWCAECAGVKKLTLQHCIDLAISKNGKCLSTEYKSAHTQMSWECKMGPCGAGRVPRFPGRRDCLDIYAESDL